MYIGTEKCVSAGTIKMHLLFEKGPFLDCINDFSLNFFFVVLPANHFSKALIPWVVWTSNQASFIVLLINTKEKILN